MSAGELLSNMGIDLDEAVYDMKQDPIADIASRGREKMIEVLRVARKSKNLNERYKKDLKVLGAAALEVLHTRADCPTDSDVSRQLRAIKEELAKTKAEALRANEEAERLRKEIAKSREKREKGRSRRTNRIDSSSASTSSSPDRTLKRKKNRKGEVINLRDKDDEMTGLEDISQLQWRMGHWK